MDDMRVFAANAGPTDRWAFPIQFEIGYPTEESWAGKYRPSKYVFTSSAPTATIALSGPLHAYLYKYFTSTAALRTSAFILAS